MLGSGREAAVKEQGVGPMAHVLIVADVYLPMHCTDNCCILACG